MLWAVRATRTTQSLSVRDSSGLNLEVGFGCISKIVEYGAECKYHDTHSNRRSIPPSQREGLLVLVNEMTSEMIPTVKSKTKITRALGALKVTANNTGGRGWFRAGPAHMHVLQHWKWESHGVLTFLNQTSRWNRQVSLTYKHSVDEKKVYQFDDEKNNSNHIIMNLV